jgi:hypothetical protein
MTFATNGSQRDLEETFAIFVEKNKKGKARSQLS